MDADSGQSPISAPPPSDSAPVGMFSQSSERRRRVRDRDGDAGPSLLLVILVSLALLLLVGGGVAGFGFRREAFWRPHHVVQACPRPPAPGEAQPQFNEQQRDVRDLRRQAFRGDFFAQLELAQRYEGQRPGDKNLQDPVEAVTWYSLALSNPDGYDRTRARPDEDVFGPRLISLYDDCRSGEREIAYRSVNRLMAEMSTDERDKARKRVIYVLSTQGPTGFRTLSRLHDVAFGPFGEPPDDGQALFARRRQGWPDATRLFERNGVDAYMFDYLAMQTGDQGAYVLLQDLQRTAPWPGLADIAEQRARRWVPPYEFYPPDAPESGVPHTDESYPIGEVDRIALYRINQLPFKHFYDALVYLHVTTRPCASYHELTSHDIKTLQAMLGRPTTGWLTPLEKVRAIQYAAVNGSRQAQLVLAVMYAQGVGVSPDYARAFHWFAEADRQGSPEAKFAIATYFSEGLAGVADQAKAEAVVHQLDAALSGFRPSTRRLSAMLERVSGASRGWRGYSRPEDEFGPDDHYGYDVGEDVPSASGDPGPGGFPDGNDPHDGPRGALREPPGPLLHGVPGGRPSGPPGRPGSTPDRERGPR